MVVCSKQGQNEIAIVFCRHFKIHVANKKKKKWYFCLWLNRLVDMYIGCSLPLYDFNSCVTEHQQLERSQRSLFYNMLSAFDGQSIYVLDAWSRLLQLQVPEHSSWIRTRIQVTPRLRFSFKIRVWAENNCCGLHTVDIPNVQFASKIHPCM